LVAETEADKEQYTYVQDGKEKDVTIYINTRIYKISKSELGTKDDMYIIYVRRGVLDAPGAVEAVARVLASYISLQLPTWRHRYETLKELEAKVKELEGKVSGPERQGGGKGGGKRGKGPVLPVLALVALLPLAARRR
ncbi:MAG: hypothetical protein ABGY09_01505, partial [Euryarchaeota archaeon]